MLVSVHFTKLFSSITESTVWCESDRTRLVWVTMLAMADKRGRVWASIPGLANRARVPIEDTRIALGTFLSPDEDSRTPEWNGRRIEPIDGGWRLLNYDKYRAIKDSDEQAERNAAKQARYREKQRMQTEQDDASQSSANSNRALPKVTNVDAPLLSVSANNPIAEAEAEAEAEIQILLSPSASCVAVVTRADSYLTAWNTHCGALAKVLKLSSSRNKKVSTREKEGLTVEQFTEAVKLAARTPFLRGEPDGGWRCNFDWLIQTETNLLKVLEGKYGEPDKPKSVFVELPEDQWRGGALA